MTSGWSVELHRLSALMQWEAGKLVRSWVMRFWLVVTALGGFLLVVIAASSGPGDSASDMLSGGLSLYLSMGSLVFIILSASSVAGESDVVRDAILSRPIARYHYILAKVLVQVLAVVVTYVVVVAPVAFLIARYQPASNLSATGAAYGLASIGLLLAVLAALGVTVSALLNNSLMSMVAVTLVWLGLGTVFSFLKIDFLSPARLLSDLPTSLSGTYNVGLQWEVLGSFMGMLVLFGVLSVGIYLRKDL